MFSSVFRSFAGIIALLGMPSAYATVSVERSVGFARVEQIVRTETADLVVLDAGQESGFRQGMVCSASRNGQKLGEILLVELRPRAASALILDLKAGEVLLSGDQIAVKTVSSRK